VAQAIESVIGRPSPGPDQALAALDSDPGASPV
jgi:hypothetical protein